MIGDIYHWVAKIEINQDFAIRMGLFSLCFVTERINVSRFSGPSQRSKIIPNKGSAS